MQPPMMAALFLTVEAQLTGPSIDATTPHLHP